MSKNEDYLDQLLNSVKEPEIRKSVSQEKNKKEIAKNTERDDFSAEESFFSGFGAELDEVDADAFLNDFELELDEFSMADELDEQDAEEDIEEDIFAGLHRAMGDTVDDKNPIRKVPYKNSVVERTVQADVPMDTEEVSMESLLELLEDEKQKESTVSKESEDEETVSLKGGTGELLQENSEEKDLLKMLSELSDQDDELSDIAKMLKAQDNKEDIPVNDDGDSEVFDDMDLLTGGSESEESNDEAIEEPEKEKRKTKKNKKKKEENPKGKNGFFSKIATLLFGEGEASASEKKESVSGSEVQTVADENLDILNELQGNASGAKKKKAEKDGKKKQKAAEKKEKDAEKKSEKPKKEKPKREKTPKTKEPPLPRLPVFLVILMSASILALVLLAGSYSGYTLSLTDAKDAYGRGDYLEAYSLLAGMELKKKDEVLLTKTSLLAGIETEWNAYRTLIDADRQEAALDCLVRGLGRYDKNKEDAKTYQVFSEYKKIKNTMEKELKNKFNLSYKTAVGLYEIRNRKKYSIEILKIVKEL